MGSGSTGEASGHQSVGGTGAIPKSLPSEIKSGVNAALAQAQQTYQVGMSTEYEAIKQQMQQDMMQFMKDINDCMAEWRRDFVKENTAWQASTQVRQAQIQQLDRAKYFLRGRRCRHLKQIPVRCHHSTRGCYSNLRQSGGTSPYGIPAAVREAGDE